MGRATVRRRSDVFGARRRRAPKSERRGRREHEEGGRRREVYPWWHDGRGELLVGRGLHGRVPRLPVRVQCRGLRAARDGGRGQARARGGQRSRGGREGGGRRGGRGGG